MQKSCNSGRRFLEIFHKMNLEDCYRIAVILNPFSRVQAA